MTSTLQTKHLDHDCDSQMGSVRSCPCFIAPRAPHNHRAVRASWLHRTRSQAITHPFSLGVLILYQRCRRTRPRHVVPGFHRN